MPVGAYGNESADKSYRRQNHNLKLNSWTPREKARQGGTYLQPLYSLCKGGATRGRRVIWRLTGQLAWGYLEEAETRDPASTRWKVRIDSQRLSFVPHMNTHAAWHKNATQTSLTTKLLDARICFFSKSSLSAFTSSRYGRKEAEEKSVISGPNATSYATSRLLQLWELSEWNSFCNLPDRNPLISILELGRFSALEILWMKTIKAMFCSSLPWFDFLTEAFGMKPGLSSNL